MGVALREKEKDIQRTILDGLTAMKIFHIRMNSGAMFGEHAGKKRMLRFGRKGMADIQVIQQRCWCGKFSCRLMENSLMYPHVRQGEFMPLWLEVKRRGEKQTEDQINFQYEVEAEGHRYAVVHSWEEVLEVLNGG